MMAKSCGWCGRKMNKITQRDKDIYQCPNDDCGHESSEYKYTLFGIKYLVEWSTQIRITKDGVNHTYKRLRDGLYRRNTREFKNYIIPNLIKNEIDEDLYASLSLSEEQSFKDSPIPRVTIYKQVSDYKGEDSLRLEETQYNFDKVEYINPMRAKIAVFDFCMGDKSAEWAMNHRSDWLEKGVRSIEPYGGKIVEIKKRATAKLEKRQKWINKSNKLLSCEFVDESKKEG